MHLDFTNRQVSAIQCVLEKRKTRFECEIHGHSSLIFKNHPCNLTEDFLLFPMIPFTPMLSMWMTDYKWFSLYCLCTTFYHCNIRNWSSLPSDKRWKFSSGQLNKVNLGIVRWIIKKLSLTCTSTLSSKNVELSGVYGGSGIEHPAHRCIFVGKRLAKTVGTLQLQGNWVELWTREAIKAPWLNPMCFFFSFVVSHSELFKTPPWDKWSTWKNHSWGGCIEQTTSHVL